MEIKSMEETVEDMPKVETKRRVTAMDTILSKDQLDENDPGYQKPEPKEENSGKHSHKPYKKWNNDKKSYNNFNKEKKDENEKNGDKRRDRD
jgi:hypothetical protein